MSTSKIWQGNSTFILAAAGSAVGLGNIWKFPYMVGSNGGSAFVFIYLICIFAIGLPVMVSEIIIGKYGRKSPINSLKKISVEFKLNINWKYLGVLRSFSRSLILSYYSVFAGMAFSYIFNCFHQDLKILLIIHLNYFFLFTSSPGKLIFWHSLFIITTCLIVGFGVIKGIGRSVNFLMPFLIYIHNFDFIYSSFVGDLKSTSIFYLIQIFPPLRHK